MSHTNDEIEYLRRAILFGFDKVPQGLKTPEGEGSVRHLGFVTCLSHLAQRHLVCCCVAK